MDSRTRLVEATQDLLWEQGYSATSPKDIMRRSGAGQGSMYHHFTNKQELAVEALERSALSMRHDAEKLLAADGSACEIATAYLRRQRDVLKGCRMGRMTFDADVLNTPELIEPVTRTFVWLIEALTVLFERGRDHGEFAADIDARNQLVDEALALIKDKQRQNDMSANVKQLAAPHSARRIVELMESIISQ